MRFYFTYGVGDDMDHKGGWTTIDAPDIETAEKLFIGLHPYRKPGIRPYCSIYPEAEFRRTRIYAKGNAGHRDWEFVTYMEGVEH